MRPEAGREEVVVVAMGSVDWIFAFFFLLIFRPIRAVRDKEND